MKYSIAGIYLALLLASCNRASSLEDAEIPACASSQHLSSGNEGTYQVSVDKECWKPFVEAISNSGGDLCRKQLMSGEGCEFTSAKGEFILSPLGRGDDGKRTFVLTDLRH
jgi:hypothetical protein